MNTDPHPRDAALRELLVASVDATPLTAPRRARMSWRPLVAFVAAGVLTGGAVGIAASAAERTSNVTMQSITITKPSWVRDDMTLIGDPIVAYDPRGPVSVGERPADATHLAVDVICLAPEIGYTHVIDDTTIGHGTCSEASDTPRVRYGGSGSAETVSGSGPHDVTVTASGSIAVWLSWIAIPPAPEPSAAQQAELADGAVTLEEYRAAFARYRSCLQDAGHDVSSLTDMGDHYRWVLMDEVVSSGADEACYRAEFAEVDTRWQSSLRE